MFNKIKKFFLILALVAFSSRAFATDLIEVYEQAITCDPTYQQAWSTMLANTELLPQSFATLLPQISGTANSTWNYIHVFSESGFNNTATLLPGEFSPLGTFKFNTNNYTLTLNQTIINFTNWMQVKQNSYVSKQAVATFRAASQDLMVRVATAYLNVLQAQDTLTATEAQKLANAMELDQTKQRYNVGLDAITSVYNAQAAYDAIVASEIAAKNTLRNNLEALRQLTGRYYPCIEGLKIPLPLIKPNPLNVDLWVCTGENYNQTLLATRYAAEAARAAIKAFFGGHLPTLNAVATWGRTRDEFSIFNQGTIGVQLNMPIYQGGFVNSQVRQAKDQYATAVALMVNSHRQTIVNVRQNFNNVFSGISKVEADRAAILSSQSSLDSTLESFKVGTRTIVDVLIAQQQLYQQRLILAQDAYAYLTSTLLLKQAAGTLCPKDLAQIDSWLHGPDRRNIARYLQPPAIGTNADQQTVPGTATSGVIQSQETATGDVLENEGITTKDNAINNILDNPVPTPSSNPNAITEPNVITPPNTITPNTVTPDMDNPNTTTPNTITPSYPTVQPAS